MYQPEFTIVPGLSVWTVYYNQTKYTFVSSGLVGKQT